MAPSSPTTLRSAAADTQIWTHLKIAIANSSGFKRWTSEQQLAPVNEATADPLVRRYLRETLETLAY